MGLLCGACVTLHKWLIQDPEEPWGLPKGVANLTGTHRQVVSRREPRAHGSGPDHLTGALYLGSQVSRLGAQWSQTHLHAPEQRVIKETTDQASLSSLAK